MNISYLLIFALIGVFYAASADEENNAVDTRVKRDSDVFGSEIENVESLGEAMEWYSREKRSAAGGAASHDKTTAKPKAYLKKRSKHNHGHKATLKPKQMMKSKGASMKKKKRNSKLLPKKRAGGAAVAVSAGRNGASFSASSGSRADKHKFHPHKY